MTGTANALAPMEATHILGASSQPSFLDGTSNTPTGPLKVQPAGFYEDHDNIVHLKGLVKTGKGENPVKGLIFQLPPGDRPASGSAELFFSTESTAIFIFGSNTVIEGVDLSGDVWLIAEEEKEADLSGITFRAES